MSKTIAVIDGNSLMYRAFYALPLLSTPEGAYTNAVYGFLNMAFKIIDEYQPTHMAVAFDMHAPTFRHEKFRDYKAGRKETPPELIPQFDLLRQVLTAMRLRYYQLDGYEADDILGTIAGRVQAQDMDALLVTGDRDAFQLIAPRVNVLFTKRGTTDVQRMDEAALKEKYGIAPAQVPDLKALMGDASDNIPGIAGIGEKTAVKLLEQFGTLDAVLDGYDQLKGKLRERVENGRESAQMSRELATIDCNIPLDFIVDDCILPDFAQTQAAQIFTQYGFKSLLSRLRRPETDAPAEGMPHGQWEQITLTDPAQARPWIEQAMRAQRVAVYAGDSLGFAFAGKHCVLPVRQSLIDDGLEREAAFALLKPLLESGAPKAVWDKKALRTELRALDITLAEPADDVMLCQYLLEGQIDSEPLTDAPQICDALDYYRQLLARCGMQPLYADMELPLADVLYDMEREGFTINVPDLRAIGEDLNRQMKDIEQVIYLLAGHSFNILSPKQLGQVLFEELALPASKKTKTGYSTDAQVLEGLIGKHDIIEAVLEYRMLSKLYGTYIDGLISKADASGRIHTTFYQTGTATGRLSSADPNLQNIPVRTEQGRVIRRVFIPSRPENLLVAADYSQIELRVLAHMSGDEAFIQAFLDGADIHAYTAAEVFGVPLEQVSAQMRSSAKAVNFGIIYGISEFGLSRNIGITRREAGEYIARFFDRYPKVKQFMDGCVAQAKTEGYVQTMFGRRRYVPQVKSSNYNIRSFGERIAMNAPIQGTAADIIKIAMVRVGRALKEENLHAKLILQVHDELIIESSRDEAEQVAVLLRREMEQAARLNAPLAAEVKVAKNWLETK